MEDLSVSKQFPGWLSLRFAVIGQHARAILESVRDELPDMVRAQTWSRDPKGLDALDLGTPLSIGDRKVGIVLHALNGAELYGDRHAWPLYGGLITAAGRGDSPYAEAMVKSFVSASLPVWCARQRALTTSVVREGEVAPLGPAARTIVDALTKGSLDRLGLVAQ